MRTDYERNLKQLQDKVLAMGSMVEKAIILSMDSMKERDVAGRLMPLSGGTRMPPEPSPKKTMRSMPFITRSSGNSCFHGAGPQDGRAGYPANLGGAQYGALR
ncbi:hypothetical protein OOR52_08025 [Dehalogenimonas etheniformans]|nr:hypothetical protein [Dehalogenimonas etheniformans]